MAIVKTAGGADPPMIDFGIYKGGRRLFANVEPRNVVFAKSDKGPTHASCLLPISLNRAARWLNSAGLSEVRINSPWGYPLWSGRIEDVGGSTNGTIVRAFGHARAFADVPYTALWSYTGTSDWREVTEDELAGADPSKFQIDRNNRLYMAVRKNHSSSSSNRAILVYKLPDRGSRSVSTVSLDYDITAAGGLSYVLSINAYTAGWVGAGAALVSTTTTASGSLPLNPGTGAQFITVQWRRNSSTPHEYTGDTGDAAVAIITNIRIKTTSAALVTPSAIAASLRSVTHITNPGQMVNSDALIAQRLPDLLNAMWEDTYPNRILDDMATPTHTWGVDERKQFFYQPRSVRRTWTIEAGRIDLPHSLNNATNSVYVVFRDPNGRKLRTTAASSQVSIAALGVTRRVAIDSSTTSESTANAARDEFLASISGAIVADIETLRITSSGGRRAKAWEIEPGDRVRVQNAPQHASFGEAFSFVVARMSYNHETGAIALEPREPTPTIANILARQAGGGVPR